RASIEQLSTPIIPVYEGVIVVPLVGVVDAERASHMIEQILGGVSRARAAVVIVDLTGVPIIDAEVADHLIRTAQAVRLLGSKAARALVDRQADRGVMRTLPDLQSGIEHALRTLGLAIGPRRR